MLYTQLRTPDQTLVPVPWDRGIVGAIYGILREETGSVPDTHTFQRSYTIHDEDGTPLVELPAGYTFHHWRD